MNAITAVSMPSPASAHRFLKRGCFPRSFKFYFLFFLAVRARMGCTEIDYCVVFLPCPSLISLSLFLSSSRMLQYLGALRGGLGVLAVRRACLFPRSCHSSSNRNVEYKPIKKVMVANRGMTPHLLYLPPSPSFSLFLLFACQVSISLSLKLPYCLQSREVMRQLDRGL